jgi:chromate reductase, NAD(P)H dehydrogenase (quinone)
MAAQREIAVLVGSLRKESFTRKTANALIALAPQTLKPAILDTASPPPEWTAFRDRVRPVQGVLFVTPEYNRSIPGLLKNAIDVGSRPYGKSVWDKKPAGIVSVSPGVIGAFGANHHLRQSLVFLNMPAMQMPEAYVGGADKLFDAQGTLINDSTREFLGKFMQAYAAWVEKHAAG